MKIVNVVGARPNFMKIAPLIREMKKHSQIEPILVHTGQHYDRNMSRLFFRDLKLPKPDIFLGVGSGTHAEQTAKIMIGFEKILLTQKPDITLVVGDVNSTIACALTSKKLNIPVAHIEAGLRSFDSSMPEEINRVLTDAISDYLFITERSAEKNLKKEGISKKRIFFVGNVMIDTLLSHKQKAGKSNILSKLGLSLKNSDGDKKIPFALLTLHRPSNVDVKKTFEEILEALEELQKHIKIVIPLHPRTQANIEKFGFNKKFSFLKDRNSEKKNNVIIIEPLGYFDFLKLMSESKFVMTDSGGIQEETTVLGIPCLTLRNNTERPVTISNGTNILVGTNKEKIIQKALQCLRDNYWKRKIPFMWDGKAAERIIKILLKAHKRN